MTALDPRPTITDQEVAALPLAAGRADLLEEIMATPVLERPTTRTTRRAPGWVAVGAAAAAVAAIALAPTLGSDPSAPDRTPRVDQVEPAPDQRVVDGGQVYAAPAAPVVPEVPGGRYVGLEAAGWSLDYLYEDAYGLTVVWTDGPDELEVNRYPADQHAMYHADRARDMEELPGRVFGQAATTWAYSPDDHATMTTPVDGYFFEVRARGMALPAYDDLIGLLVRTDEAGFYEGLPEGTVTPANRDQAVAELLQGVPVPAGFGPEDVELDGFNDPYQAGAAVAGSVGCAWLGVYAGGTPAEQQRALDAFSGSTDWPVLVRMADEGGYPDAFWSVADALRAGDPPSALEPAIC